MADVDFGKAERDMVLGCMVDMLASDLTEEEKTSCALLFALVTTQQLEHALHQAEFTSTVRAVFG